MKFAWGRYQFGFTHDVICNEETPYLERWILWCGITLRLHRFLTSDEDRAVHDHPWWFITVPFTSYHEYVERNGMEIRRQVAAWRPHFRGSRFRHRVEIDRTPSWTLVLTGIKNNEWGFWQESQFVHNRDWTGDP